MAASFAYLRDLRPYTTAWRVQVKVLHSWRQYTIKTGETFEMVLADEQVYKSLIIINLTVFIYTLDYFHVISQGVKIHATVKKDLVTRWWMEVHWKIWGYSRKWTLQGQSLEKVGLFLPRPVFSHGQLYVALSRVTSKKGLKILILDKEGKIARQTTNVVFKEVFQNLGNWTRWKPVFLLRYFFLLKTMFLSLCHYLLALVNSKLKLNFHWCQLILERYLCQGIVEKQDFLIDSVISPNNVEFQAKSAGKLWNLNFSKMRKSSNIYLQRSLSSKPLPR